MIIGIKAEKKRSTAGYLPERTAHGLGGGFREDVRKVALEPGL